MPEVPRLHIEVVVAVDALVACQFKTLLPPPAGIVEIAVARLYVDFVARRRSAVKRGVIPHLLHPLAHVGFPLRQVVPHRPVEVELRRPVLAAPPLLVLAHHPPELARQHLCVALSVLLDVFIDGCHDLLDAREVGLAIRAVAVADPLPKRQIPARRLDAAAVRLGEPADVRCDEVVVLRVPAREPVIRTRFRRRGHKSHPERARRICRGLLVDDPHPEHHGVALAHKFAVWRLARPTPSIRRLRPPRKSPVLVADEEVGAEVRYHLRRPVRRPNDSLVLRERRARRRPHHAERMYHCRRLRRERDLQHKRFYRSLLHRKTPVEASVLLPDSLCARLEP